MLRVLIQDQRVSIDPDKAQPCRGFSSCLLVEGHTPLKYGSVWHEAWDDSAAWAWRTAPRAASQSPILLGWLGAVRDETKEDVEDAGGQMALGNGCPRVSVSLHQAPWKRGSFPCTLRAWVV